jgi:hypothetical protein
MTDSDVETGSAAYIGNRRLRMDQELAIATRGRVQLVNKYAHETEVQVTLLILRITSCIFIHNDLLIKLIISHLLPYLLQHYSTIFQPLKHEV